MKILEKEIEPIELKEVSVRKKDKKRILWIDVLRGIAMFLVVYGHTSQNAEIKKYIYAFHMPLFFIISGMTSAFQKSITTKEFMKKKMKTLLVPYFLLNILMFPITYYNGNIGAVKKQTIYEYIIGILYSNNLGSYDAPANATWFITTLLLTEALFFFMRKCFKNEHELSLGVGILGTVGYVNSISTNKYNGPWHMQVVLTAIVFYYMGYIFMKNIDKVQEIFDRKLKTVLYSLIMFVIGMIFAKLNTRVSLTADKYGSILYFYIASLSLSFSLVIFAMRFLNIKLIVTKYIGQNCILWIAVQIPIIRLIQKVYPIVKIEKYAFILAIVVYLAIIPISLFINKFFPFICGKKYKKSIRKEKLQMTE